MTIHSRSVLESEPLHPDVPIDSVESVDDDWEPLQNRSIDISHPNNDRNKMDLKNPRKLAKAASAGPKIASPEPIRRPLVDREDSLLSPTTVSSLYNATPRSTPTPEPASVATRSDSVQTLGNRLAQSRIDSVEEVDPLRENIAPSEEIRRPPADREDSLLPPATVSSLYNATPRSTATSELVSIPARSDNLQTLSNHLAQFRIDWVEEIDPLRETVLQTLADLRIDSMEHFNIPPVINPAHDMVVENFASLRSESPVHFSHPVISVREEPLPKRPFFDEGLQKAIKGAQTIITHVADQLDGIALAQNSDSGLCAIRKQALESREFKNDAISTIAVVGESAAGKSSLINSLLDQQEVARTDDNGSAVTSYVTEYRYRKSYHKAPFTIEADFLTAKETATEIKELLHDYQGAFRESIKRDTTPTEYEGIIRRSNLALSTLQSIFSEHDDVSEEFLQDQSPGAEEDILQHLQSLVSSLTWPEGVVDGEWITMAYSAGEYHEKIKDLSQEGLFPLIRVVRVFLNALVLRSGVALADMPGLGDTNLARLQATKRYLDKCEHVFIVNKIGRAATSINIQDVIKSQEEKGLVRREKIMTVVCTGSEDIDLMNAERRIVTAPVSKAMTQDHVKRARMALESAIASDSAKATEEAHLRYASIFINERNRSIKADVIKNYSSLASQHELKVFCVSNRYYEGAAFDTNIAKDIARSVSGIRELRQFCHTVVAEAQYYAAIHYIDVKCLGLLRQLELWTQATSTKKREQVIQRNSVKELQNDFEEKIENFSSLLDDLLQEHILQPMRQNNHCAEQHATAESRTWVEWHWGTYAAFCRKNGIHKTEEQQTNWNSDMLGKMNELMKPQWTMFLDEFDSKARFLTDEVQSLLKRFVQHLKRSKTSRVFIDTVNTQRYDLLHRFKTEVVQLEEHFRSTNMDAVSGDLTSFIYTLMRPTYRDCSADGGDGVWGRQKAKMQKRMDERTLFRAVRKEVKQQMLQYSESFTLSASKLVREMCKGVQQSVQTVVKAEAGTEMTSPQLLEQMKALVVVNNKAWARIEANSQRARERARGSSERH